MTHTQDELMTVFSEVEKYTLPEGAYTEHKAVAVAVAEKKEIPCLEVCLKTLNEHYKTTTRGNKITLRLAADTLAGFVNVLQNGSETVKDQAEKDYKTFCIEYMNDDLGQHYPLPKADFIKKNQEQFEVLRHKGNLVLLRSGKIQGTPELIHAYAMFAYHEKEQRQLDSIAAFVYDHLYCTHIDANKLLFSEKDTGNLTNNQDKKKIAPMASATKPPSASARNEPQRLTTGPAKSVLSVTHDGRSILEIVGTTIDSAFDLDQSQKENAWRSLIGVRNSEIITVSLPMLEKLVRFRLSDDDNVDAANDAGIEDIGRCIAVVLNPDNGKPWFACWFGSYLPGRGEKPISNTNAGPFTSFCDSLTFSARVTMSFNIEAARDSPLSNIATSRLEFCAFQDKDLALRHVVKILTTNPSFQDITFEGGYLAHRCHLPRPALEVLVQQQKFAVSFCRHQFDEELQEIFAIRKADLVFNNCSFENDEKMWRSLSRGVWDSAETCTFRLSCPELMALKKSSKARSLVGKVKLSQCLTEIKRSFREEKEAKKLLRRIKHLADDRIEFDEELLHFCGLKNADQGQIESGDE